MAQLTVPASIDSFMNAVSPDTNYGSNVVVAMGILLFGGGKTQLNRAIGNFNLSALPAAAVIMSAKMRRTLTFVDPTGHACTVLRCTRPAQWTENGVAWNEYDGTNAWTAGGGDYDSSTPAPVAYNEPPATGDHDILGLEGFVRDAIEQRGGIVSLIMKNNDEAPSVSQRSQWTAGAAWKLIVEYETLGPRRDEHMSLSSRRPVRPRRAAAPASLLRPARGRRPRA